MGKRRNRRPIVLAKSLASAPVQSPSPAPKRTPLDQRGWFQGLLAIVGIASFLLGLTAIPGVLPNLQISVSSPATSDIFTSLIHVQNTGLMTARGVLSTIEFNDVTFYGQSSLGKTMMLSSTATSETPHSIPWKRGYDLSLQNSYEVAPRLLIKADIAVDFNYYGPLSWWTHRQRIHLIAHRTLDGPWQWNERPD